MCGTLKFTIQDDSGWVMADMEVSFESKKNLETAQNMLNTYLSDLIEQLEREETAAMQAAE